MSANEIIARARTATGRSTGPRRLSPLPPDLLAQTCRRVGIAAFVFASLFPLL